MVSPVTDESLLAQLNASEPSPVTDPSILAFLNAGEKKPKRGFVGQVREAVEGVVEPVATIGSGLVSSLAAAPMAAGGALYEVLSGNAGKGYNVPKQIFEDVVRAGTYQPRSEAGQQNLQAIGRAFQESKIPIAPQITGGVASAIMPTLARGGTTQVLGELSAANAARKAKALQESRINAPKIEAVRTAQNMEYVLPPTAVKEGGMRSGWETLAGRENVVNHASLMNQPKTNAAARQILGVEPDKPLVKSTFDEVAARTNVPYEQVAAIPRMPVDDVFGQDLAAINNLSGLQPEVQAIVRKSADAEVLLNRLNSLDTMSGQEAVRLMDELRSKANAVGMEATAAEKALAAVQKSAARSIEGLVERNLARMADENPQYANLLNDFRQARTTKAQMHILKQATNLQTGNVNAAELGRRAGKGVYMTGKLADIAEVASQFPQAFRTPEQIGPTSRTMTALTGGLFGAAGATVGGPLGAIAGPVAWQLARTQARKTALSPRMQRGLAMEDARPMRERMGYGEPVPEPVPPVNPIPRETPLPQLNVPLIPGSERIPPQPSRAFRTEGEIPAFRSMPPDELTGVMTRQLPDVRQPVQPLPNLSQLPPVATVPQVTQGRTSLPVLPDDLLPVAERYRGTDIPIGRVEGGQFNIATPLPELPPLSRGLLSIADEQPIGRQIQVEGIDYPVAPRLNPMYQRGGVSSPESGLSLEPRLQMPTVNMTRDVPAPQGRGLLSLEEPNAPIIRQQGQPAWQKELGVDFPLRQEVLQTPEIVTAVRSFIAESERLKTLIKESGGFWKDRYKAQLAQLEQEFAAGMRQLGIDNPKQALGLQKLYQSEEGNALQIKKTSGLLD